MNALVSEALMDATWRRVGGLGRKTTPLQLAIIRKQEELHRFVLGGCSLMREDAQGIVLYLYVVIAEAFRQSGPQFKTVKPGKIISTWEKVKSTLPAMKEHGRPRAMDHAESTAEPAVFRYIISAMEEKEGDPVDLDDDEFWLTFTILQTASECLHDAAKRR